MSTVEMQLHCFVKKKYHLELTLNDSNLIRNDDFLEQHTHFSLITH